MTTTLLEASNVSYHYCDNNRALANVNLKFTKGTRSVVLGANGAGKSTLFMLLNGLYRPSSGKILFDGKPLEYTTKELKRVRSSIGVLFQDPDAQLISASLREDVSFGPMNLGLNRLLIKERVNAALAATRLEDLADRPVHSLSYGQKKRAGIAGLLAMQPEVLILDEPTAGLDKRSQQEFFYLLEQLMAHNGVTIILSTHDIDLAYSWADQVYVLDGGKVVAHCDRANFASEFPKFAGHGFIPPQVIELYLALKEKGVIPHGQEPPRCLNELAQIIKSDKFRKGDALSHIFAHENPNGNRDRAHRRMDCDSVHNCHDHGQSLVHTGALCDPNGIQVHAHIDKGDE
ncbi:MAG: energy-coupling factor ABC transporter ATP-binding protein [Oligoflexia bacterium]|nr:energy-coupling factor ABC transporter ATP-binding protein [Oligoflexia bacterium]